jgi:predicted secreted protein
MKKIKIISAKTLSLILATGILCTSLHVQSVHATTINPETQIQQSNIKKGVLYEDDASRTVLNNRNMNSVLITQKDMTVKAGEVFYIKIHATSEGSTGYHWDLLYNMPKNVEFIKKTWTYDNPNSIGSPGVATFEFKAISPLSYTFYLLFAQVTPSRTIADTLSVNVTITA